MLMLFEIQKDMREVGNFASVILFLALFAARTPSSVGFSFEDFFFDLLNGTLIKNEDKSEAPSPFGENNKKFPRDKSLDCSCGLSKLHEIGNEVNTSTTSDNIPPNQAPWLVLIYVALSESHEDSLQICSGTIINDFVIVTAASCLIGIPDDGDDKFRHFLDPERFLPDPEHIGVAIASENITEIDLGNHSTFTRLQVEEATFNPFYLYQSVVQNKSDWDIAFILLKKRLNFSDLEGFVPLCLPTAFSTDRDLEGVEMFSLGWMKTVQSDDELNIKSTSYSLRISEVLQVHPKYRCQAITSTNWISDRHFCTNGPRTLESKFTNAQGGPFMIESSRNPHSFIQYGIVSWDFVGIQNQKKNVRVSTNLSGFLQVIEDFSDYVGAKWCSIDYGETTEPQVDSHWDGGTDLNKPIRLTEVPSSEWIPATSEYRQRNGQLPCECGRLWNITNKKFDFWMASVVIKNGELNRTCGGSLVNDKIVITTASCIDMPDQLSETNKTKPNVGLPEAQNVKVYLRGNELRNKSNLSLPVDQVIPHPEYNKLNICIAGEHDIALVVLKTRLDFTNLINVISPICLPMVLKKGIQQTVETDEAIFSLSGSDEFEVFSRKTCKEIWGNKVLSGVKSPDSHSKKCEKVWLQFNNKTCGGFQSRALQKRPEKETSFLVSTSRASTKSQMKLIGLESGVIHDHLKPVIIKMNETMGNVEHKGDLVVLAFNNMKPLLPFIEFVSVAVDAKWCAEINRS